MTNEEAIIHLDYLKDFKTPAQVEALNTAIEVLKKEPCEDAVSRQAVLEKAVNIPIAKIVTDDEVICRKVVFVDDIEKLPPVTQQPKMGRCKDCRWWKDSDGAYRRGIGAESHCPINRSEVYAGNGYCFMFEPQESEEVNE